MKKILLALGLSGFAMTSSDFLSTYEGYKSVQLSGGMNANAMSDNYVKNFYQSQSSLPSSEYFQLLWKVNNSAGALGYLNGWYQPNTKEPSNYQQEVSAIKSDLQKGRLNGENFNDTEQLNSILSSLLAGNSYGYVLAPTTKHLGNYKREYWIYYSFVAGQQKVREATIREHAERITQLKKELSYLYSQINSYCKENPNKTKPIPDQLSAGSGVLRYQPVIRAVEDQTEEIRKLLCLNYLAQLHQTKVFVEVAELQLLHLNTSFGLLQNEERRMLESLR